MLGKLWNWLCFGTEDKKARSTVLLADKSCDIERAHIKIIKFNLFVSFSSQQLLTVVF